MITEVDCVQRQALTVGSQRGFSAARLANSAGGRSWNFGHPLAERRAMLRILKTAKLPQHFTPHCLRHTYASIVLADGVSPVYVQEQLGHATIERTVSTYGR
jgi:integrase